MKIPDWTKSLADQSRMLGASRLFRDGQAFTREGAAEVVRRLAEFLNRGKRTQKWAAESMGIHEVTLNGAINDSLMSQNVLETVIRQVDKWLEGQISREQGVRPERFFKSGVAIQIFAAAKCAMQQGAIALVHGPAGIGKTYSALAVQAEHPGSVYIAVKAMGNTGLAVLELLAKALQVRMRGTRARVYDAVESALRDTGRLIIVDEFHRLAGRRSDEGMHALRDLHDGTGCPMLWLGMSNAATYIQRGHANDFEPLDQVYSRIALWLDLTEQAERTDDDGPKLVSIEDIRAMIAARQLRITRDGEGYLLRLARKIGAGAFRTVDALLAFAAKFVGAGKAIDAEMLRSIQAARLGVTAAESLETRMAVRLARAGVP